MYRFAPRTQPSAYRPLYNGNHAAPAPAHFHNHNGDGYHYHRGIYFHGYVYPYSYWYGYPLFTGYVNPWLFGNCWTPYGWNAWCDNSGYSSYSYDGNAPAAYPEYGTDPDSGPYPQQQYYPQQYSREQQPPAPENQSSNEPQSTRSAYAPSGTPATGLNPQSVTVIFNDGRPPEQIKNYLLTAHTLTVFDSKYQEIPLSQVNLAATAQVNRAAGVEFRVPIPH